MNPLNRLEMNPLNRLEIRVLNRLNLASNLYVFFEGVGGCGHIAVPSNTHGTRCFLFPVANPLLSFLTGDRGSQKLTDRFRGNGTSMRPHPLNYPGQTIT